MHKPVSPAQQKINIEKAMRRAAKAAKIAAGGNVVAPMNPTEHNPEGPVDCACVIHGNGYSWDYVEKLYSMLSRHISRGIRLHVYTEEWREVSPYMVKHVLQEWPDISGPKKSWWYKMQLFNAAHHSGPLLYFDLDTVIVDNVDWAANLTTRYFWAIKEFKNLWDPRTTDINSSMMYWDTTKFHWVWEQFAEHDMTMVRKRWNGDQDFISEIIPTKDRRFFEQFRIQSWRWQAYDGGLNFKTRKPNIPGAGTKIAENCSVLVFHGNPKPANVKDPVIVNHWI